MLSWLENWLHSIIAVILFAVVVELLLPNSKFLKYTRLVIGLILLITIMSPLLKLFEKDYMTQIDASYVMWEKQLNSTEQTTFSLQDIQAKAQDLKEKREQQTLKLTEKTIENQMLSELIQAGLKIVSSIDVDLEIKQMSSTVEPIVKKVQVYISLSAFNSNETLTETNRDIKDVQFINIEIEDVAGVQYVNEDVDVNQTQISNEIADSIITVLQRNWNLNKNIISIVAVDVEKR